jgi:hypothetical protein
MKLPKFFHRTKKSEAELREEEENRVRAAAELRQAEQESERSRHDSKVPGAMRNIDPGGGGGGW